MVESTAPDAVAVTIVGAGPTGLTLAVELHEAGVPFRILDTAPDAVHESRALAIQARTLEVLDRPGVAPELIAAGDSAARLTVHASRAVDVPLFDDAEHRTAYPFLLFLSQAETERILLAWLSRRGVQVERGVTVGAVRQDDDGVELEVTTPTGDEIRRSGYVVGADGAHSAVRAGAGIPFSGRGFPQAFALADLEVGGLQRGRVHAFISAAGILFFVPLGSPATWRLLAMLPTAAPAGVPELDELQRLVDRYSGDPGRYSLSLPVWVTTFTVQSRRAGRFRQGRVFLAGDAAHIHSPAGGQGMNTGIQDAVNLGWKLARVVHGTGPEALLDTYEEERLPIARDVLRMTNRLFRIATAANPLMSRLRPRLAPIAVGTVAQWGWVRDFAFRTVSQIALDYRGRSLSRAPGQTRWQGLRAGDRLPDIDVISGRRVVNLRRAVVSPGFLLAGLNVDDPEDEWPDVRTVFGRVPGRRSAWILIRPDGYIAGIWRDPQRVRDYLDVWGP
jgi:2-polyprenyl-6-methoxyphenol hydroxylase-like FAD-dependent oxidoreductase